MIKGDHDYLQQLTKAHICGEHNSPLVVAWHSELKEWVLRCAENHYPDEITKELTLSQAYRQGKIGEGPSKEMMERRERKKMAQEVLPPENRMLQLVPQTDFGTGQQLSVNQLNGLVTYAHKYGLDPYRGHVMLMYGQPYIGLDGYIYHAAHSGRHYNLRSRPMTLEEATQYKVGELDHGWLAEIDLLETNQHFNGVGIVTYSEMTEPSKKNAERLAAPVVAAHPWQLAQKRAEWQVLRRAFPIRESAEEGT